MSIFIDDITALEAWRRDDWYANNLKRIAASPALLNTPSTCDELRALHLEAYLPDNTPIYLATANPDNRPKIPNHYYHVVSHHLPASSFREIEPKVYRASPELCFLRLAKQLSLEKLIEVGMELCGTYALVPEARRGFVQRETALTSVSDLTDYLSSTERVHGLKNARAALRFLQDGSASPMETRQFMMTCMPMRLGGFGLSGAEVNGELKLPDSIYHLTGRRSFRCDLIWRKLKVVVEYDSKEDHFGIAEFMRDNAKRNVLTDKGIKVFVISSAQILDPSQFKTIMWMVARALGKRLRDFPPDWQERHMHLRKEIFASMKSPK